MPLQCPSGAPFGLRAQYPGGPLDPSHLSLNGTKRGGELRLCACMHACWCGSTMMGGPWALQAPPIFHLPSKVLGGDLSLHACRLCALAMTAGSDA